MIEISKQYQNPDWLVRISREKIQEFSKHERFMIRIQAIHFINRLAAEVSKDVLNKDFVTILIQMADDPVPNIKFNVSKSIDTLY